MRQVRIKNQKVLPIGMESLWQSLFPIMVFTAGISTDAVTKIFKE
jgi:hypothetical protein